MLTLGMIGCGYWGPNLLRNYLTLDGVRVKAVADRLPERRAALGKSHPGVTMVEDGDLILRDPEIRAVVIATPAASHARLVREALDAGKDVFVEKPLAMRTEDA